MGPKCIMNESNKTQKGHQFSNIKRGGVNTIRPLTGNNRYRGITGNIQNKDSNISLGQLLVKIRHSKEIEQQTLSDKFDRTIEYSALILLEILDVKLSKFTPRGLHIV